MPANEPPASDITPRHLLLPAGSRIWRVHRDAYRSDQFSTRMAHSHFGGGRFDSVADDPYAFLYAASGDRTALSEVLLRDAWPQNGSDRILLYETVSGRSLAALHTTAELKLISLVSAEDLAAISQDDWIVQAPPHEFGLTRYWARWLRTVSDAQGIAWQSRRDRPNLVYLLFGDRCPPGTVEPLPLHDVRLCTPNGLTWLNEALRSYRATVAAPAGTWC